MKIIETEFPGLKIIEPRVFKDDRGYFFESYNYKVLENGGVNNQFVQDNQSKSVYGVIRGLHYQLAPYSQTKYVRCLQGEVLDVVVDLRKGSPGFGKSFSIVLSEENQTQLFIPQGFAHGFSVLSETAVFYYKCDQYYTPESERGILFNDPELEIDWKIPAEKAIISAKDKINPEFRKADMNFSYHG